LFPWGSQEVLKGQCDASWSSTSDGKGYSACLIRVFGCVVAWKSKKQELAAQSTAESELLALVRCVTELIWLRGFLTELQVGGVEYPVTVETDSRAVIDLVTNLGVNARSKHYARKLGLVRDEWRLRNLTLKYVPSEELAADILTKPVGKVLLKKHLVKFNLSCWY